MRKYLIVIGFFLCPGGLGVAQDSSQPPSQFGAFIHGDGLLRQEWTRDIFVSPAETRDDDRRRFQLRPRLELVSRSFLVAIGADANYSSDKNLEPTPALLRDNYDSRDFRLDLAVVSLTPTPGFQIQGGRFVMPIPFTEMIWDKDLRPQGASLSLRSLDEGGNTRLGLTLLGARGSHVFDDRKTQMLAAAATIGAQMGPQSRFELTGSYIRYEKLDSLAPFLRRQNTVGGGAFQNEYGIVDVVGRLRSGGSIPTQLVANVCVNLDATDERKGLWLAGSAGSLRTVRAEYTFATVDRDATVAAYATDDFFWSTGWLGHRLELSTRASAHASLHALGQLQRFKDSPRPEERDHWVKRFRVELRYRY